VGERAEIAITVGVTGLAAYVGYEAGGLVGAQVAAVVPAFVGTLFAQREDNLVTVTEDAAEQAGIDGDDLVAWLKADDRHAAFFAEALEVAWSTLDRQKLRALSYVLADGFQDDARLDVDQLVVKALRELEAPHVRVLDVMASTGASDRAYVRESLPELSDGLDAIFAGLERAGCLAGAMFPSEGAQPLVVTEFGRTCLEFLRKADSDSPWTASMPS
jgi:hypothetical protein